MTRRRVIVPFFISHQGCPYHCVFCDQRLISGADGSLPSPEVLCGTVDRYRATAGGRSLELAFYGGSFTCLPFHLQKELLNPVAKLRRDGTLVAARVSTRPDALSPDQAAFLASHGISTVELGVQSFDDAVLSASGRGHVARVVAPAVTLLKGQGLEVGIQLMPGLPEDTPEKALDGMRRAISLMPDLLRIYPVVVLAGTELAAMMSEGRFSPWSLATTVAVVKQMLLMAMKSGIPVARIGLHASDSLSQPGAILGGGWHPALGDVVTSALWKDLILKLLAGTTDDELTLRCHPSRVSSVVGHGGATLKELSTRFPRTAITVRADRSCSPTGLVCATPSGLLEGDIMVDLDYDYAP